jgi:hypothetical protein
MPVFYYIHCSCMWLHCLSPKNICAFWYSHINFIDNLADRNYLLRWKEYREIKLEHSFIYMSVKANKDHAIFA